MLPGIKIRFLFDCLKTERAWSLVKNSVILYELLNNLFSESMDVKFTCLDFVCILRGFLYRTSASAK